MTDTEHHGSYIEVERREEQLQFMIVSTQYACNLAKLFAVNLRECHL